ncbi:MULTISPECIES: phage exclusion protein Lit family protein [Rhizobium/Agrobacterium group]|uniref:Peptidase U49-like protein n=1 Tax=Agrobacterium tumefaciens TaxID=358 RepID=A0A2Z2PUH9_AGRTU|nr:MULTISPECIES: phage exclusion protein Lit family protein [Rhizobium/Agrobacterium group]ASK45242.1 hypothetical protein [Agrobacterium radiobacter]NTH23273.1 hypothetical protein [Rhizobium rhizogenes]NTH36311.1 hypothetical protein [Rhizobium rhizogenes]
MTDAERLTRGFVPSLRESPFRIAPERLHELLAQMGGETWVLEIVDGPANFEAFPTTKEIEGTYAALLSLWAVAASVRVLSVLTQTAAEMNHSQIVIIPGGPGSAAIELKNAASALIRNEEFSWDDAPAEPHSAADPSSPDGLTNNLFLAAASFVVLHECGHLVLGHQAYTALMHQQEREADAWAVSWILDKVPSDAHREFRTLAICVAFIWIGLIDEVRRATSTHPRAAQRLADAFINFGSIPMESPALEISYYALKAFFDPTTNLSQADSAKDGFIDRLIDYTRSQ